MGKLSMSDACKGKYYQLLDRSDQNIYIVNSQWHLGFYSKLYILTNNALKLGFVRYLASSFCHMNTCDWHWQNGLLQAIVRHYIFLARTVTTNNNSVVMTYWLNAR